MQPNLNVMTFVKQTHDADFFCLPIVCTCSCTGHLDVLTVSNTAENNDMFSGKMYKVNYLIDSNTIAFEDRPIENNSWI